MEIPHHLVNLPVSSRKQLREIELQMTVKHHLVGFAKSGKKTLTLGTLFSVHSNRFSLTNGNCLCVVLSIRVILTTIYLDLSAATRSIIHLILQWRNLEATTIIALFKILNFVLWCTLPALHRSLQLVFMRTYLYSKSGAGSCTVWFTCKNIRKQI